MKHSHAALRLTLLIVFVLNLLFVYLFLFAPEHLNFFYGIEGFPDIAHRNLSMVLGALLAAFTFGTFLPFFQPVKHAGVVAMLILMHFSIFVMDVILLAQGSPIPLLYLVPEMAYMLIICTLLIRFYPVEIALPDLTKTADVLVDTFEDRLKEREKQERALRRKIEKEQKQAAE
ncbi:MAG: hypothetical protein PHU04_04175 [Candidatus Peribacteraceae bacterium]|nr:hypothetical protein [Candidatus Peribacteraceae bacterium]